MRPPEDLWRAIWAVAVPGGYPKLRAQASRGAGSEDSEQKLWAARGCR